MTGLRLAVIVAAGLAAQGGVVVGILTLSGVFQLPRWVGAVALAAAITTALVLLAVFTASTQDAPTQTASDDRDEVRPTSPNWTRWLP